MISNRNVALYGSILWNVAGAVKFYNCHEVPFCSRFRNFESQILADTCVNADKMKITTTPMQPVVPYMVQADTIEIDGNEIKGTFVPDENWRRFPSNAYFADAGGETDDFRIGVAATELGWSMKFFQNGILRMKVTEPNADRYSISSEEEFAVMDSQLIPLDLSTVTVEQTADHLTISNIVNEQGDDVFSYTLTYNPLSLVQKANDIQTMTIFDKQSLYVEKTTGKNEDVCGPVYSVQHHLKQQSLFHHLTRPKSSYVGYAGNIDYQVAIGAGVRFDAQFLSGIPERETQSDFTDTTGTQPFRMFDIDFYGHKAGDPQAGYGSIPYITGHHDGNESVGMHDEGFVWINAADTWVDVVKLDDGGQFAGFVSESGILEFFVYASTVSPKRILSNLADISGHAPLPPLYSLGFHFSKWAEVSSSIMIQRNNDFNSHGFPVDVFWMDILYSDRYEYFKFD